MDRFQIEAEEREKKAGEKNAWNSLDVLDQKRNGNWWREI